MNLLYRGLSIKIRNKEEGDAINTFMHFRDTADSYIFLSLHIFDCDDCVLFRFILPGPFLK